jgi:hypothetical protein
MNTLKKIARNRVVLQVIKWQLGTPLIAFMLWVVPFNNTLIKTVIANLVGAFVFLPIDKWIFKPKNNGGINNETQ